MKITKDNFTKHFDKLGGWSTYFLATVALKHYFPKEYENEDMSVWDEVKLCDKLGCTYWIDVINKYHSEIGYKKSDFKEGYVNEY